MDEQENVMEDRVRRYEEDCEKGYFLQTIYTQKIDKKIYFYDDQVSGMLAEFAERIKTKRQVISQIAHRCKEIGLRETMVICERCKQDLAPLKTFAFEDKDLHYAKCVFGAFRRVTLKEVLES